MYGSCVGFFSGAGHEVLNQGRQCLHFFINNVYEWIERWGDGDLCKTGCQHFLGVRPKGRSESPTLLPSQIAGASPLCACPGRVRCLRSQLFLYYIRPSLKDVVKQCLTFYKLIKFMSRTELLASEDSTALQFLTVPKSNVSVAQSEVLWRGATSSSRFLWYVGVCAPAWDGNSRHRLHKAQRGAGSQSTSGPKGERLREWGTHLRLSRGEVHRITESLRLEKTSKMMKFNHHPSTPISAKPCPQVPHPHVFWTPPGKVTPPLPWAACSSAWPLFQ